MRIYIKINTAVNTKINPMFIFVEIIQVCGNHTNCGNHTSLWKSYKLWKSCKFVEIMQIVEIMHVCGNHARFYTNYLRIKDCLTFGDSLVFKHRPSSRSK